MKAGKKISLTIKMKVGYMFNFLYWHSYHGIQGIINYGISAVALIFAIAMVLGGYLLLSSRNLQTYAVEEGTSCPYFW